MKLSAKIDLSHKEIVDTAMLRKVCCWWWLWHKRVEFPIPYAQIYRHL